MAYGTKYRIGFSNNLGEDYHILFNKKNYVGDAQVIIATASALTIKSINGDDDPFSPILSKECSISMFIPASQNVTIRDFMATEDDEFSVVVYRDMSEPPVFDGFLLVEDCNQPLLDRPFQLQIRASDGLPLLKTVPLAQSDGSKFIGLNNITDYIGHILYYVHPDIPFKVYYDIYHVEMNNTTSPLQQMQVDAKVFEKDEVSFEDCYTVLTKICNDLECRIFYENGSYHVVSIWQYRKDYGFNSSTYLLSAGVVNKVSDQDKEVLVARIGKTETIYAINKDAIIYSKVATKSVKKTFNYDIPKELVKNQTFAVGAVIPALAGSYTDTSVTPNQTIYYDGYVLNDWTQQRAVTSVGSPLTRPAYIRRERDVYNYERDRFVVLPTQSNAISTIFLLSSLFNIGASDKLNISIDHRQKTDYSGNQTVAVFAVLLRGDNGTFWVLDEDKKWYSAGTNFNTGLRFVQHFHASGDDKTDWVTTSVESNAAPVSGTVQIVLYEHSFNAYPNETWYKNLRIAYKPFIKGGYAPVRGDYNLFSQNLKINKTIEETVSISDSPKKIIKGAIFVNNQLASPEWRSVDLNVSYRFTQLMALIKYNFYHRQFQKIEGTLKGLSLFNSSGDNIPFGFLPQYSFVDIPNQPFTKYILTSCDINYVTGQWRGVFVEVQIYGSESFDSYDFTYLFEQ